MNNVPFAIREIHAGWFVCTLADVEIEASYWCGHDGPRQMLNLLGELLNGATVSGTAVFAAEPGTYMLSICSGDQPSLTLWYTETNCFKWYPVGDHRVLTEIPGSLKRECLLRIEDLDLYGFACAVGDAFSAYIPKYMRDTYEKNWMPFPIGELIGLRRSLGDFSDGWQSIAVV